MFRKFASLAHGKEFGYLYDSAAWDANAPIESKFRMFQTYGDGNIQHSGEWSITAEHFADYLVSLAEVMLNDTELTQELYFAINRRPSIKQIEFAASVIYKAPKDGSGWSLKGRRYFSLKEMKISSSPSKEHDKRYTEITDVHDGTPASIFRILMTDSYADGLDRYCYAEALHDWVMDQPDMYMELPAEFLKWFKEDRDKARQLQNAYEACRSITESMQARNRCESAIANYKRSIEPKQAEVSAEVPAA